MNRIAVYAGSFDPITLGHVDIIRRIARLFDKTIVLVANSSQKTSLFTAEERKLLIEQSLHGLGGVEVDVFEGLTVEYAKRRGAQVIVRGLRAVNDFEYEKTMASLNRKLDPALETMLVFASPQYGDLSSRGVKELARNGAPLADFVPQPVIAPLLKKFGRT